MDNESNDESPNMFKKIHIWSEGDTKLLLELHAKYLTEVGPLKKFRNKKDMWAHIANEISGKTAKQCEERYKTVLKRKKSGIVTINRTSESKRQRIDFEDELNFVDYDSMESDVQMNSQLKIKIENVEEGFAEMSNSNKTVQEVLLEIAAKEEAAKERRHMEMLDAINRMQIMLQNVLEDKHNNAKVNNSQRNRTIQETLLEIAVRKEEGRERRHMEKLDAMNKMQTILQTFLED